MITVMINVVIFCVITADIGVYLTKTKTVYKNSSALRNKGTLDEAVKSEITNSGYKFKNQFVSIHQEKVLKRSKYSIPETRKRRSITISDANWADQWTLKSGHTPSMGVYNAWDKGYTGQGVTVAIVDDGIDVTHVDLADNYNASLSYDYIYHTADASHAYVGEGHGTNCAGIIAAVKNEHCIIGIAYEAKIAAIRLLDSVYEATEMERASALIHQLEHIDIYSSSWVPTDDWVSTGDDAGFNPSDGISSIEEAALLKGVKEGRKGKGAIYMWGAGNGGGYLDDCSGNGYANTIYTISINSLGPDSAPAWYAEECTAVLAAAYGGDDSQDRIATTSPGDQCIDDFQGSSAACSVASGIIALVLQANPDLTWRDIQHIIVQYSTNTRLRNANFYSNAAGKQVSLSHGFGLLNAEAMVDAAPNWQAVSDQIIFEGPTLYVNLWSSTIIVSTWTNDNCSITSLEHVHIIVHFKVLYWENTKLYLVSPEGTESRILRERLYDGYTRNVTWTFMSVHTWGENPFGMWTLRMDSSDSGNTMDLYSWSLTLYGTTDDEDERDNTAVIFGAATAVIAGVSVILVGGLLIKRGVTLKSKATVAPQTRGITAI